MRKNKPKESKATIFKDHFKDMKERNDRETHVFGVLLPKAYAYVDEGLDMEREMNFNDSVLQFRAAFEVIDEAINFVYIRDCTNKACSCPLIVNLKTFQIYLAGMGRMEEKVLELEAQLNPVENESPFSPEALARIAERIRDSIQGFGRQKRRSDD